MQNIFIQNSLTEGGLLYLISYCKVFLSALLSDGIPLRGAISHGPISIITNKRGTTIFGLGLTKAYILESIQQWAGTIVDRDVFNLLPKTRNTLIVDRLLKNKTNPLIVEYDVPIKEGKIRKEYVLDWTDYNLIKSQESIRTAFSNHKKDCGRDKVQLMIENTIDFYKYMKSGN